ncbi:MAG: helix-turn-helix domain-containing GNAT family N-acetyltransferase [Clostridia bacterium]|nr:helix-turn-helix domain-containing GNAT family N-acetyltransferase [Clostridia bacterium]
MSIRQETIDRIREFNRYYTVHMNLLNSNYLESPYSLAEIRVLFEIWKNQKCIQDKIVKELCIDKSYLSRILKNFQKKGIIQKSIDEHDKRNSIVSLTPAGELEIQDLFDQTNKFIDKKIANLDLDQCSELCKSLACATRLLKESERAFKVIPFEERYRQDFIDFNTDWITTYFEKVEKHDIEEFENIDKDLENGAMIFVAVRDGIALATCMAKPLDDSTWEICKLASNKNLPHKGAGNAVFEASANWALNNGAKRLFILSNSKLKPALHIYKKFGFKEIKLDNYGYERGNIAFEYVKK